MVFIIVWAVLLVAFIVMELEFFTDGLFWFWFALGAAGALISAALAPQMIFLQLVVFLIVSGAAMYFIRPLAKGYFKVKQTATNANRVLEMIGVVRESIDNMEGRGAVHVGGKLWTARSEGNLPISEGTQVDILRIEGVKLIVRPHEAETVAASD